MFECKDAAVVLRCDVVMKQAQAATCIITLSNSYGAKTHVYAHV